MGQKQAIFDPCFLPILQMTSGFGQMTKENSGLDGQGFY